MAKVFSSIVKDQIINHHPEMLIFQGGLISVHPETLVFEGPELLVKEYFS